MWETLRKFGLGYCDFPTQIWNVAVMLRVVALNIERRAQSIPKYIYVLNAACAVCYIFDYQIAMACFVFVGCQETGDVLAGILAMSVSFNSLIGITKLIYMYIYQDNVQSIISGYITYDQLPLAPNSAHLLVTTMRAVKKRALIFWATMMGNGFLYNLQSLVMPSQHMLYDDHVRFGLKFIFGTTNYQLAIISIVISVAFICFVVSNITALLIITTGYSEGRMLALSQEMRELWSDALQHYRDHFDAKYIEDTINESATKELNNYVKRRLNLIVKSHAMNIGLIKKIEAIFRDAIAAEFILLTAALIAALLGGLEQTYIILPFALMQVSMDCYIGQNLIDASMIFEKSVYDCKWENFDVSNMKTVLLILKLSQRRLALSAGGVANLSFECLMVLYKSVYSAYTALRSTME